ncbi:kinase-like domain-containing protein [Lineolata rhizophorae]|uniref:Kinase-like domain-containing protein n=1 Tax=Lineolata rhizophorae TaxID=578093 RepID=A0A6A6NWR6_9PEZI|nr:kinase-like domain-containing protein [Lineolata rhizophorae]
MALLKLQTVSSLNRIEDANPYSGLPVVGLGMTARILYLNKERVIKVAKTYAASNFPGKDSSYVESINNQHRETLKHERSITCRRLGDRKGIIPCFKASEYGIELAFAKQGDLEKYIKTNPEPHESLKTEWILILINALSFIHSRRVFVDEIALRNILVANGQLKFCDFGQSYLLPLTADVDTICENDLTAKIEILHLGWVIYSIAVWDVHKYYYFDCEDPQWPSPEELPATDHLFWGTIIQKCWNGDYVSMIAVNEAAQALKEKAGA